MKGESLSFRLVAPPSTNGTIKERVKANGTVTRVGVRFYPGQEKSLRVKPYVLHKENRAEDMFTYPLGTDTYLSGDNDLFSFDVVIDVAYDDEIVLYYENVNTTYSYSVVVDMEITYHEDEGVK